jgi:TonB family protein
MTPIVKDVETSTAASSPALPSSASIKNPQETTPRSQPMPLEIQVTVNGARTIEGTDKREPFSESTKTVLVFANGAVIRLVSSVAPGQLLFVTNEKSKKEVVCQVLKSRNDGKATGYVELEFTEPAAGFWGVRIPGEGVPVSPPAPAAVPKPPVAPRAVAPAKVEAPTAPAVVAPKIAVVPPPAPAATLPSAPVTLPAKAVVVAPSPVPASVAKPEAAKEVSSEDLKQQAARLQEQLNALLFREAAAEKAVPPTPAVELLESEKQASPVSEVSRQIFGLTEAEAKPAISTELAKAASIPQVPAEVKPPSIISKSSPILLPVEEVKIPSWLAPLARETESVPEEAPPAVDHTTGTVSTLADASGEAIFQAGAEEASQKSAAVIFGGQLLGGAAATEASPGGSKAGLFLGLAAASALLIGGGVWYGRQPGNFLAATSTTSPAIESSRGPANESAGRTDVAATVGGAGSSAPASGTGPSKPVNAAPSASKNAIPAAAAASSAKTDSASAHSNPIEEEPKKPVLGDVHLATPTVNRSEDSQSGEGAPSIDNAQTTATGDTLAGIASAHTNGPAAPLPIGGDVKVAHLLKATPPVYPPTARSQRVSGDVKIDALIDASGMVTSTTVISGPAMLHQAAMTAVKQWKYEPAELNGKPTAMHLTVTVQFRLQ